MATKILTNLFIGKDVSNETRNNKRKKERGSFLNWTVDHFYFEDDGVVSTTTKTGEAFFLLFLFLFWWGEERGRTQKARGV